MNNKNTGQLIPVPVDQVAILGASGFIGGYLASYIVRHFDCQVTLFSRTVSPVMNLLATSPRVRVVTGDYKEPLSLVPLLSQSDLVYHLISASIPATSWVEPELEIRENLLPSLQLLKLCSELGVKKVAFLSSGGTVYGVSQHSLHEDSVLHPFSPYGIIKATIEYFLEYYRVKAGMNYNVFRLSNPYGPGQEKIDFGVISTWLKAIGKGQKIHVYGDGTQAKDFIFIEDAIRLLAYPVFSGHDTSDTFNVCSGQTTDLNTLLGIIQEVTGLNADVSYTKDRRGDNTMVKLDNSKLLQHFPNFRYTPLKEGIEKMWQAIREAQ